MLYTTNGVCAKLFHLEIDSDTGYRGTTLRLRLQQPSLLFEISNNIFVCVVEPLWLCEITVRLIVSIEKHAAAAGRVPQINGLTGFCLLA